MSKRNKKLYNFKCEKCGGDDSHLHFVTSQESTPVEIESLSHGLFLVSACDLESVKRYNWTSDRDGYLTLVLRCPCNNRKYFKLHRFILGCKNPKLDVDHIDGNVKNNTRENLRVVSRRINNLNRKKSRNVCIYERRGKYSVRIGFNGKLLNVGTFECIKLARRARDKKLLELDGQIYGNICE